MEHEPGAYEQCMVYISSGIYTGTGMDGGGICTQRFLLGLYAGSSAPDSIYPDPGRQDDDPDAAERRGGKTKADQKAWRKERAKAQIVRVMDLNNGTAAPAGYRILLPASFSVCGGSVLPVSGLISAFFCIFINTIYS